MEECHYYFYNERRSLFFPVPELEAQSRPGEAPRSRAGAGGSRVLPWGAQAGAVGHTGHRSSHWARGGSWGTQDTDPGPGGSTGWPCWAEACGSSRVAGTCASALGCRSSNSDICYGGEEKGCRSLWKPVATGVQLTHSEPWGEGGAVTTSLTQRVGPN